MAEERCKVCGWPLAASVKEGCVAENCSMRPQPATYVSDVPSVPRDTLLAAVAIIKEWHNMPGGGTPSMERAWRIYWRNAPEMAPIRAALPHFNLDDPEKLIGVRQ